MGFKIVYNDIEYLETNYLAAYCETWELDNLKYETIETIDDERFVHAEGMTPEFSYNVELLSVEQLLEFMEMDDQIVTFYPDIDTKSQLQMDCKLFCTVLKNDGMLHRLTVRLDFYSEATGDIMDDGIVTNPWQVVDYDEDSESQEQFYLQDFQGNYLVWEE